MTRTVLKLADGRSLAYDDAGEGGNVVLLHPIGLTSRCWDAVAGLLRSHFRVLVPDLPGHGDSDPPSGPYEIAAFADDVAELAGVIGEPPVAVMGLSMGGMVGLSVAARRPELVASAVVVNSVAELPDAVVDAVKRRAEQTRSGGMAAVVDETLLRWFTPEFADRQPDVVAAIRAELLGANPEAHAETWLAMTRSDLGVRLESIHQPVLVLTGSQDLSVQPAWGERIAERLVEGRHLCLEGAGHMSPIEEPERFVAVVEPFVAETLE